MFAKDNNLGDWAACCPSTWHNRQPRRRLWSTAAPTRTVQWHTMLLLTITFRERLQLLDKKFCPLRHPLLSMHLILAAWLPRDTSVEVTHGQPSIRRRWSGGRNQIRRQRARRAWEKGNGTHTRFIVIYYEPCKRSPPAPQAGMTIECTAAALNNRGTRRAAASRSRSKNDEWRAHGQFSREKKDRCDLDFG